jgi:hypothetical protein
MAKSKAAATHGKKKTSVQPKAKAALLRAVPPPATVLVLRTCDKDMQAHGGFVWPKKGLVAAPDWKPRAECGNGLHGFLWGEGDGSLASWDESAKWLVVEVEEASIVQLSGKVKFPRGVVVHCGDRLSATTYIAEHGASGRAIVGGTATAGARGTATAGYAGTATAGDSGTATAGYAGTATAGDSGTATAGARGTATAGDSGTATAGARGTATAGYAGTATAGYAGTATAGARGTATAGDSGTATAGARGTATAGDSGTATAGDSGTATAGDSGTATAGYAGTATAGYAGTATAGARGTIQIRCWVNDRYRIVTGYVGEEGILANVKYRLNEDRKLVPVEEPKPAEQSTSAARPCLECGALEGDGTEGCLESMPPQHRYAVQEAK